MYPMTVREALGRVGAPGFFDRLAAGVVLHTGPRLYGLGERIVAAPICSLWGWCHTGRLPSGSAQDLEGALAARAEAVDGEVVVEGDGAVDAEALHHGEAGARPAHMFLLLVVQAYAKRQAVSLRNGSLDGWSNEPTHTVSSMPS